jgi:hypothetical protein
MGRVIEMSLSGFCSSSFLPLWSFAAFLGAFFDFIDFLLSDSPVGLSPCLYANPAPMSTMLVSNRMAPGALAKALNFSIRS